MHTQAADLGDSGERGMRGFVHRAQSRALSHSPDSGNPAVIEHSFLRPVTLRPYLSIGLPFYRMLQLRIYTVGCNSTDYR
jgi:hypothetical protein